MGFGIIFGIIGVLIVIIGIALWKYQKITLIHGYHHTKVKKEDVKPYTEAMGKATITLGITIILMAIFKMIVFIPSFVVGLIFVIGFFISMTMFYMAQNKYNNGVF